MKCSCEPYEGAQRFYTARDPWRAIGQEVDACFTVVDEEDGSCLLRCQRCARLWRADYLPGGGIYGDWEWQLAHES